MSRPNSKLNADKLAKSKRSQPRKFHPANYDALISDGSARSFGCYWVWRVGAHSGREVHYRELPEYLATHKINRVYISVEPGEGSDTYYNRLFKLLRREKKQISW